MLQVEATVSEWFQQLQNPVFDWLTSVISLLASEWFYVLIIPLIFWMFDKHLGFRLLYVYSFSMYLHVFLNQIIIIDRPAAGIQGNGLSTFPSGPVQAATTFWGYLIPEVARRSFSLLAVLMIGIISFVTLYTGAHLLFDVLGAVLIGSFIVYAAYRSLDWVGGMPDPFRFSFSLVLPCALLLLFPESAHYAGLLLGTGIGFSFEQVKVRMLISPHWSRKFLAAIVGLTGLFLIVYIGTFLSPTVLIHFLHFTFLGLWITLIAPYLFVRLRLFEQDGKIYMDS
ncbi:phosphatase PAP2 family protein [Thalassorhabdus alkalitolerans]|uniref:Phosphatase PAP2 family protein n=1 Tax=Thalassorhabdus alkalitolerans TaxID=2282697 RepID=A0ABW0YRI0_9BACI